MDGRTRQQDQEQGAGDVSRVVRMHNNVSHAELRHNAIALLAREAHTAQKNSLDEDAAWLGAREAEAELYSVSPTVQMYRDQLLRAACNVHINGRNCGPQLVVRSDASHTKGTIIDAIRETRRSTKQQFESMLRDKRASARQTVDPASVSLKCRRCGSADVTWDVKQTRSSDESSTAFCVCSACANRWVIK